jgi:hypothetical protein
MQSMAMHSNEIWIQDGDEKRKLEGQELIDYQANIALVVAEVEAAKAKIQADAEAKSALLTKLGITAEEAQLLLS